jgi:DNA (cytosine-5)-methyltransferase 1
VGRVANGVADRVDRLKALGNGQVSFCAASAWRILNELATS